ncbi:NUDIX hydrolase [Streptomyces sp. NBC_00038]|uniref:NUDIX hydrolase n=1 Tax=Streptomyces sp. NBC_00038 TaxID=2903615 RepID=UPI00224DE67E|nr:NUDIX hydrolase [Streptomyces sp. NBC_00038]MCX5555378.1 NUDIX hydrolase [Streptomyces sp. NBC_00038]
MPELNSPPPISTPTMEEVRAYYAAQPAPLFSATGLVVDTRDRVLVLSPSCKDHLELPGGLIDDTESPEEGLARGLKEALGLAVTVGRLLAVDSAPSADRGRSAVMHLHLVGPLDKDQVAGISFPDGEIVAANWYAPEEALARLPEPLAARLRAGLAAWHIGAVAHLVDGQVQRGSPAGLAAQRRAELEHANILDPASWRAVRPKVLAWSTVLFTDAVGRVLLLQPTYRTDRGWELPGCDVDSDLGENPRQAARRAVREQLGLDVPMGRLLATNWANKTPHPAQVGFTYNGGVLGEADLARIRIDTAEIHQWRLAELSEVASGVAHPLYPRIEACLSALHEATGPLELYGGVPWA